MLQKCINTKSKTILRYSFYDLNIYMHQKILIDLRKRHISYSLVLIVTFQMSSDSKMFQE